MLATIKGYYEKGRIVMSEDPPVQSKTDVIITFLTEAGSKPTQRIPGGLKSKIHYLMISMNHWMILKTICNGEVSFGYRLPDLVSEK